MKEKTTHSAIGIKKEEKTAHPANWPHGGENCTFCYWHHEGEEDCTSCNWHYEGENHTFCNWHHEGGRKNPHIFAICIMKSRKTTSQKTLKAIISIMAQVTGRGRHV
jgi:hypothetical protein